MNRSDPNRDPASREPLDELLSSFLDGELTQEQQMEIRQLIADDEKIARRLRELQNCRLLVASLPFAAAPADTLEQVRAALRGKFEILGRRPSRRVLAVAAIIALMAVLAATIYSIFGPAGTDRPVPLPPFLSSTEDTGATALAGRLELRTGSLKAVDTFINRAIKDNELSDCVHTTSLADRKVYSFSCSRFALNLLLADLASIWEKFDSTTLIVQTPKFGEQVVVNAIAAEQVAQILAQEQGQAVRMAKDFAVLNNMAQFLPGKEMLAAAGDKKPSLITIPKPVLTGDSKIVKKLAPPDADTKQVELTIVVIGSK